MYESLHLFEVLLRDAMDEQLCRWNATQTDVTTNRRHSRDWLLDPSRLLRRLAGEDIDKATKRAERAVGSGPRGRTPGHEDVLAQLTLGTRRFLLPDSDDGKKRLWTDALHLAFPHRLESPTDLVRRVDAAYRMRNRVAHLKPIFRSKNKTTLEGMRAVLNAIDPHLGEYMNFKQRLTHVLKAQPPS